MEAPTTKFFSAGYCPKVTPALSGFDEPSLSGFSPCIWKQEGGF